MTEKPSEISSNKPSRSWSTYMTDIYVSRRPPLLDTVAVDKIEEKAREKMKDNIGAFLYVFGSAGTCSTDRANRAAFDKWKIVPRMLRNASERNIETTIFGVKHSSPLILAPIGVQAIMHPEAELATARAAKALGVGMVMSTASSRSMEEVGEANGDGERWFQLYWPRTNEVTASLLSRAKSSGFTALVITLDTVLLGWRPHDLDTAYLPFGHGTGIAVGTSDPVFMSRFDVPPHSKHVEFPYEPKKLDELFIKGDKEVRTRVRLGREWLAEVNSGHFRTWEDLKIIREHWDGPVVLKGIQSIADAEMAVDFVDGIVVSNHGGRQVDGAIASLDALAKICMSEKIMEAQSDGKFTVLFDSGIRTGSDIIKALALGAQAVLLGRPYIYGLCLGGQAGIEQQVRTILADMEITMGLCGYKNVEEIREDIGFVVKESD
ncbi:FMN-dependent alpha-hydroxy acid dehydrogenase [Rickenella mellea]|uniref:FMN-dependent alpha-hydroxy acid dehydrogenase n=1 Tax=Rickenella mellea TaxID=50990 RepID=A0A4Y7PXG2_9AGAM|nr:FMN-dependent alpha-hydroxy acid dehydrogenase [Rickenella mellea]